VATTPFGPLAAPAAATRVTRAGAVPKVLAVLADEVPAVEETA